MSLHRRLDRLQEMLRPVELGHSAVDREIVRALLECERAGTDWRPAIRDFAIEHGYDPEASVAAFEELR